MLSEFVESRDNSQYSVFVSFNELDIKIPMFAGIHYAIMYKSIQVFDILLPHEASLLIQDKTYIPTMNISNFQQSAFMDKQIEQALINGKTKYYSHVPANSTILDLCIYANAHELLDKAL